MENNEITSTGTSLIAPKKTGTFMFQFDQDEPVEINTIYDNGKVIIEISEGSIQFQKYGKEFKLFIKKENE